jgi:hypothetical protein
MERIQSNSANTNLHSIQNANNWARFCVGLLEFSDTVQWDTLEAFLQRYIDHFTEEFTIGHLLVALGMPCLVTHFTKLVAVTKVTEARS